MLKSIFRLFSLTLAFLYASLTYGEGFIAGTLIKTPSGYTPIEKLCIGDSVICYDSKDRCIERPITHVIKKQTRTIVQLTVGDELIVVEADHKFYLPQENTWVEARALAPGHVLLKHCTELVVVEEAQEILQPADVYDISVADYHNFCVSHQDVHVHNFIPFIIVGISWAFGAGAGGGLAVTGTLGVGALALGAMLYNSEHRQREAIFRRLEEENQRTTDHSITYDRQDQKTLFHAIDDGYRPLRPKTPNQQAEEDAAKLGYKKAKNPPFNSHNKPAFKKGERWITEDRDSHKGGRWKMFDSKGKRLGTFDGRLEKKIGN
jgi:hypothetical protein